MEIKSSLETLIFYLYKALKWGVNMFGAITYRRPVNLIVVVNAIAYMVLYFYKKPFDMGALLVGLSVIAFILFTYFLIIKKDLGDEFLFLIVSMLTSLGIIMIYRLDSSQGLKQILWFGIGIIMFIGSYYIYLKVRIWYKLAWLYIISSVILYVLTILLGTNINGSNNWIVIHGFSFQLSEFSKILFIFFLACYFKNTGSLFKLPLNMHKIKPVTFNRILLMLVTYMNVGFLIMQREWGTTVLIMLIFFLMIYVFDNNKLYLLINFISAIPVGVFGYFFVYHIRVRVDIWLNPWIDASGKGYQIVQSLFGIISGGFFGTGIGMGKPDLVPAANTDFIFTAICEEMGIFGGVALILLYFLLTYRGIKIVLSVRARFEKILALGITVVFGLQTFIIIGGVIKLIPLTGITLPFVSYGGSSLLTGFILLGILQAISKRLLEYEGN
jgi:cell division protein FtsW (lipid II flippase)